MKNGLIVGLIGLLLITFSLPLSAAPVPAKEAGPSISINMGNGQPVELSVVIQIMTLLTVLTLAPAILMMMTSFIRIVIVFSFLRQALGTMQAPPNQVIISLALFLTLFVMTPVWQKINQNALQPYLNHQMSQTDALTQAEGPLRSFMLKQVREKDLALFVEISKMTPPKEPSDIPMQVMIPAFMISELRTAFQIGFLVYLPFLVIDLVVASILMSMGMMMLPPVMVSLPFKLILFVLSDGWYLVVGSLVKSFGT
jgi:flagellar biosynthetic protein FliP